ncbi:heterokaryon incompatibility protein-domain-containing protein [Colletotrichum godetiae]|uniref:Heterokaryon incompatibility protein-domain-containing protein n=1 Tax=Colletotrichum godetiae TaxID=1209918 RepID=A0AAJ0AHA1_9PEZI|nr:heterokaryon incompatibility protein-domain-containing protein [Colletotrichum godetiae]KAK1671701.1 heterokaryon incompatibility protein-domain-containing protein [Colletotrichum godetiae]
MDLFQYEPLNLTGNSFRLLMLHPGSTGEISCDIFEASLDPDGIIPYEALSYAWGNIELSASITANGKTLRITNNLFTALSYLRDDSIGRVMWIDAICIDQNDVAERGHQVGQMAGIYKGAEQVLIWLGPSTSETKLLLEYLRKLQQGLIRQKSHHDLTWAEERWSKLRQSSDLDQVALASLQRKGLISLLSETWFTRIWVLQEVSNARAASVCCGRWSIQAYMLDIAAKLIGIVPDDGCQAVMDLFPGPMTRRSPRKNILQDLLEKFRKSEASDPRDMVYALLGIASDVSESDLGSLLLPDYSKTEQQLIRDLNWYLFFDSPGQEVGHDTMASFLEMLPRKTGAILRNFVLHGHTDHAHALLERGHQFTVNETIINEILGRGISSGVSILLDLGCIEHPNLKFVPESVLESSLRFCDLATAKRLLSNQEENIQINRGFVDGLINWNDRELYVLRILSDRGRHSLEVTQDGLVSLLPYCDPILLKTLLEQQTKVYRLTRGVLNSACQNQQLERIIDLLLQCIGGRTELEMSGLLWFMEDYSYDEQKVAVLLKHHFKIIHIFAIGGSPDESVIWSSTVTSDSDLQEIEMEVEDTRGDMECSEALGVRKFSIKALFGSGRRAGAILDWYNYDYSIE